MALPFFHHLGLKFLSLGLALLLWFLVAGQRDAERSLRVPLEYRNIPAELELLGDPVSVVDVRVRGASGALGQLIGSELVAILDLKSARPGRRLFHLTPSDVSVPTGVSVVQVSPPTISLSFEASASRTVPVVPDLDGEPAPGFEVGRVTADPSVVEVIGPASAVQQITEAITEPVSVRGATSHVRDFVTIGLPDAAVRLRNPRSAAVLVEVLPVRVSRTIDAVPVVLRNVEAGRTGVIRPASVTVTLRGRGPGLEALTAQRLPLFVDVSGLGPGRYNLPVRIDPTPDYAVETVDPPRVEVRLR